MEVIHILILISAGIGGGFIAGLIGVGGGVVFAPVLFFYFSAIGLPDPVVTPLTLGSSLLCTMVAAMASAYQQVRRKSVFFRVALSVGLFSALFTFLVTRYVTTQPWYDGQVFQIVFSCVLLFVVVRTVWPKKVQLDNETRRDKSRLRWPYYAGIGGVTGSVASSAGIGGGVIMVPAFYHLLRLPMHLTVGTSSASIVLISFVGVLSYVINGWGADVSPFAVGYVDFVRSLLLAVPAIFSAQFGVMVGHRSNTGVLRLVFALFASAVSARLLIRAFLEY